MKTLFLVRHAKSSWDDFSLSDIDRPLKRTGVEDAYLMAELLKSKNVIPEILISSPATRALNTAIIFSRVLNINPQNIRISSEIYESSPELLIETISNIPDVTASAMLFGHDPSLTNLYHFLCEENIEKLPTSSVATILLPFESWNKIKIMKGKCTYLYKPKELKANLK